MPALHTQRLFFTFFTVALWPGLVQAGAWTHHQGHGQFILNGYYYVADSRFDNDGYGKPINTYTKYELNPYIEYGLTPSITIGGSLSLQAAIQTASETIGLTTFSLTVLHIDMGDSEFFAKGLLYDDGKSVISTTGLVKLPSPHFVENFPPIGSSNPDLGVGISAGHGFSFLGQNHFVDGSALYRYRFGDPKDQLNLSATLGVRLSEDWMLMPQAFATFRAQKPAMATFTQSPADDYNELKMQLSMVYAVTPDVSIQLGGFATLEGKNTGKGKGALLSIWRNF